MLFAEVLIEEDEGEVKEVAAALGGAGTDFQDSVGDFRAL